MGKLLVGYTPKWLIKSLYLIEVDDALSHGVCQRVDVFLLLFSYTVYSDVGDSHHNGWSPE